MEASQQDICHVTKLVNCQPEFLPLTSPVCTSTPNVERTCPKLLDSIVSFPKIDDSGFGGTPHLSPHDSSCISTYCQRRDKVKFSSTPLTKFPRLKFPHSACSSDCLNESDSPSFCAESETDYSPSSFQESSCHEYVKHTTEHSKTEEKFYEIWEEEAEHFEDEAYHSKSGLDGSSHHADFVESFRDVVTLKYFPLPVTKKLIGRRIGVEEVDIVGELHFFGVDVISLLLPFLQPEDICRISHVCHLWRRLCFQHAKASEMHHKFLTQLMNKDRSGKENEVSKDIVRLQKRRAMTVSSGRLSEIQPIHPLPQLGASPLTHIYSSSPSFLYEQTRQALRWGEKLRHCPKCHSVSKVLQSHDRGQCLSPQCKYDFCILCLARYHHQNPCEPIAMKKTRTDTVGSKKSKKNLRRL